MPTIAIVGSLNFDMVTTAKQIPVAGETVAAKQFETHFGGKGANQALAACRLSDPKSTSVKLIGRVGADQFGCEIVASMKAEGINMTDVTALKGERTGIATILVESETGENRILVYPGANGKITPEDIKAEALQGVDYLILQNEVPLPVVYKSLELASSLGIKTVYNPSPVSRETPKAVFKLVDYLIVNSNEAQVLSDYALLINGDPNLARAVVPTLYSRLRSKCIIITLGGQGCVYFDSQTRSSGHVPAVQVKKIVDTTGAGDTFLGGLTAKLVLGTPLKDAVEFASRAAAIAVTRAGAFEGIPRLSELESVKADTSEVKAEKQEDEGADEQKHTQ